MPFYGTITENEVRYRLTNEHLAVDVDEAILLLKNYPEAPSLDGVDIWWDEEEAEEEGGEG